ncbi:hypothetical protein [Enterocloster clostridioformis]|uniref:hypothetical protein n=1 Tax=Enterocloster clostridioformis TaxID=1531 RepID=UPI00042A49B7|nr:hypothetical protein [Enterocloster clostridioformis]
MWEKENKVRQYILPIGYTVVMTLCVPLHMMLLECALLAGSGNAESSSWLGLGLYGAGVLIYLMAVAVLRILNVVRSFQAYRQKDIRYCVNGMLILKYGMVLFFIINYVVIAMIVLAGGLAAFVGSCCRRRETEIIMESHGVTGMCGSTLYIQEPDTEDIYEEKFMDAVPKEWDWSGQQIRQDQTRQEDQTHL